MNLKHWGKFVSVWIQLVVGIGFLALTTPSAQGLSIQLVNGGGIAPGSPQEAGFQQASAFWETFLGDDVTVRLDVDFALLSPGVLGGTDSTRGSASYDDIRLGLAGEIRSVADTIAVSHLPAGSALNFRTTQHNTGLPFLDQNNTNNNSLISANLANAKALGLYPAHDTSIPDAEILFNTDFAFDFDPSDGIQPGLFDFVGIAIHEIGHALGFISGADFVDGFSAPNTFPVINPPGDVEPIEPMDLDAFSVLTVLDLFRYSAESLALPGSSGIDLHQGADAYFSIDGGLTSFAPFSTGQFDGDGRQPSHWKDNLGLGIMDPTFARGEFVNATLLDLLAFDVIGYEIVGLQFVPMPGAAGTGTLGFIALGCLRRRRR